VRHPAAPTFEASKCARIMALALAPVIERYAPAPTGWPARAISSWSAFNAAR